jgi:N-acetylmuramoyl-L-alanine amidase
VSERGHAAHEVIMRNVLILALALAVAAGGPAAAQTARPAPARRAYEDVLARERALVARTSAPAPRAVRALVAAYEDVARRYARTGYADNALWQGGNLSADLHARTRAAADRDTAIRLLRHLVSLYPSSTLVPRARTRLDSLTVPRAPRTAAPIDRPVAAARATRGGAGSAASSAGTAVVEPAIRSREPHPAAVAAGRLETTPAVARLVDLRRSAVDGILRVTIELDAEVSFREERLTDPARLFFDLRQVAAPPRWQDQTLEAAGDDIVKQIRVGTRPENTTRIAMDLAGVKQYSVFSLYDPFRIVVDFERDAGAGSWPAPPASTNTTPPADAGARPPASLAATARPPVTLPAPAAPATNSSGSFSLSRQLGLGVSRVVIDPGHGGHDPGARGRAVTESELVLDVALRLERLLLAEPGIEVVLTRRTDVFIALEERTAIANREGADLFLSIHANASRNTKARGVETYFLNFATNPEAEAVAARENSASGRTMHHLPDIVKAIALNNKLDESRDFARLVQRSMVKRLQAHDEQVRDLGVKQAPFVVLIGAQMPSVLAEISFVTHPSEGQLLRAPGYRQQIAEALRDAIQQYQRSLKNVGVVAAQ